MHPNVRTKLLGMSALMVTFTLVVGLLSIANLARTNELSDSMYSDRTVPLHDLGIVSTQFMGLRRLVAYGIATIDDTSGQAAIDKGIADAKATIDSQMTAYAASGLLDSEKAALAQFQTQYSAYSVGIDGIRRATLAGDRATALANVKSIAQLGTDVSTSLDTLSTINADEAARLDAQITSTDESSRLITIVSMLLAAGAGIGLAIFFANRSVRDVNHVKDMMASLAAKDATWLAEGMRRLAENDLTYTITPATPPIEKYGTDEIGKTADSANVLRDRIIGAVDAYNLAREGLAATVTQVREAAEAVNSASGQLNEAAAQTGSATQQVATTIGQVAGGTAEQARAASDTNAAVEELSAVISQVGEGAAATSAAVERAAGAMESMQQALAASDTARAELGPIHQRAKDAMERVIAAIDENAKGLARIKGAVDESAVKVAELGAKGEQIGAIVETIDDIAEQTNLLALNAAIEAARAGEMGKGFAVVADEVRKLAERSGRATKEIASLIAEVQKGTQQAVEAMNTGASRVEIGLEIGRRSSASVEEILDATRFRNAGATKVYAAMDEIEAIADEVSRSGEEIARVVAETADGARRMATSSEVVRGSIGSIAAVSEENSAAAEEVSAATEEMSAQAEGVVASAATLADMAARLDDLVAQFRLDVSPQAARHEAPGANRVTPGQVVDWTQAA